MRWILALVFSLVGMVAAQVGPAGADGVSDAMAKAQIVYLGEVHDNGAAHSRQAELVKALAPAALVFEMLTEAQAERATPELRGDAGALEEALHWAHAGWPDFAMYYPIFTAAPEAAIFGAAVPRAEARGAMERGVAESFGPKATEFGLDRPLPEAIQTAREAFQHAAHCDALPAEMLPTMVELQRLRDATMARAALKALDQTGGPVVVIAGNGHARRDWGAPGYVETARPGAVQFALGIVEPGGSNGTFDQLEEVPAAEREDPCAVFAKD